MARIIVYGDLHGCLNELIRLRLHLDIQNDDIEVTVGDNINKGPHSKELLKFLMHNKIKSVLGNHEEKLIRFHHRCLKHDFVTNPVNLDWMQRELYESLDSEQMAFLESLPVYLRFGDLTVIHGGITNAMQLDNAGWGDLQKMIHMRWLDENLRYVGKDEKHRHKYFWSEIYEGHEGFIVYGHQGWQKPRKDPYALGIDTGCVYGNKLTAVIFALDSHMEPKIATMEIVQENAREMHEYKNLRTA